MKKHEILLALLLAGLIIFMMEVWSDAVVLHHPVRTFEQGGGEMR